jgi:hypothetical protein
MEAGRAWVNDIEDVKKTMLNNHLRTISRSIDKIWFSMIFLKTMVPGMEFSEVEKSWHSYLDQLERLMEQNKENL